MWSKATVYRVTTKVLTCVLVFVLLVILTGTVVAVLRKPHAIEKKQVAESQPESQHPLYVLRDGKAIYSDIGQLRALSSDALPATIVLNPYLEYDAQNIPLQEELVKKKELIRNKILFWFAHHSWLSVETLSESDIKKELLQAVNDELSLGSASSIYFAEFKVVH